MRWSSYRSFAFGEEGSVKLNQQSELKIKLSTQTAWMPIFTKNVKVSHPSILGRLLPPRRGAGLTGPGWHGYAHRRDYIGGGKMQCRGLSSARYENQDRQLGRLRLRQRGCEDRCATDSAPAGSDTHTTAQRVAISWRDRLLRPILLPSAYLSGNQETIRAAESLANFQMPVLQKP